MATTVKLEISGFEDLISALSQLKNTKARAACRAAISQASVPVVRTAKNLVPVDTRQLQKSIGRKVKTYRNSGTTVAIVGPRYGFSGKFIDKNGHMVYRNPTQAGHFVENGSSRGRVSARPFIFPALEQNRSKCENIMGRVVREHLRKNGFD